MLFNNKIGLSIKGKSKQYYIDMNHSIRSNRAFTLLELSIVLIIMSLLLTMGLEGGKYFLKQNHIKATNIKLQTIQNAIDVYVLKNKKLPCPSLIKVKTGDSVNDCSSSNSNGIFVGGNVASGSVPYKELDISPDLSFDSWGNKITYSVYIPSTNNIETINDSFTGISVYNDSVSSKITEHALYVLVSHGNNKLGAFSFRTNEQNPTNNISDQENYNLANKHIGENIYFISSDNGDDILKYKTKDQIIIDNGLEDIKCHITSSIVNDMISKYGIGESLEFAIPDGNFLNYNQEIENTNDVEKKYSIKCFKYGRLGIYEK